MKITTKIVWDMATWEVLEHEFCDYSGTISACKGEAVAQQQLKLQNDLVQKQLADQGLIRGQLMAGFGKYLNGDLGFSPEQIAINSSQFLNENTGAFNSAGSNVRSALSSRGAGNGDLPVGGDYTRGIAELEGAKASSQSQGLLGLRAQSLAQALQNQFNAGNLISGQGAQVGQNIGTFNSGATSSLGSYIQGANAPGFASSLASGLGGGFAKGILGGVGGLIPVQYGGTKPNG